MSDNKTCATCRFWVAHECRRYPPTSDGKWSAGHFTAHGIMTPPDYWCGEHKEFNDAG